MVACVSSGIACTQPPAGPHSSHDGPSNDATSRAWGVASGPEYPYKENRTECGRRRVGKVQKSSALDLSHLASKNDLSAEAAIFKSDLLRAIAEANSNTLKWVTATIMGSTLINVASMIALVKLLGH